MPLFANTHYHLHGRRENPPVLLLHGVGLDAEIWRPLTEQLSDEFAIVTYDFLGHGKSANPTADAGIEQYAAQLDALTTHLGMQQFALVGFSMGALIARVFAAQQPRRLRALALLHAVHNRDAAQQAAVLQRYERSCKQGANAVLDDAIARWFSPQFIREQPAVIAQLRARFAANPDGYLHAYRLFANANAILAEYSLREVRCPALVLTGDADTGSTAAMTRAMAEELADARVEVNRGHRHMAPVEHSEVIAGQLREFLRF